MRIEANRDIKVDIEERLTHDIVGMPAAGRALVGVCWKIKGFLH
jgi:hypothetical protein